MEKSLNKRTLAVRLVLTYAVSLVLLIIIFSAFVRPEPVVVVRQETVEHTVTKTSDSVSGAVKEQLAKMQQELAAKNNELALLKQQAAALAAVPQPKAIPVAETKKDDGQLIELKNQLAMKDRMIAQLKSKSGQVPVMKTPVARPSASDPESLKDLQKRNDNLVRGFNTLQTQMGMMTKNYNAVKAENNRLAEQLAKARGN